MSYFFNSFFYKLLPFNPFKYGVSDQRLDEVLPKHIAVLGPNKVSLCYYETTVV